MKQTPNDALNRILNAVRYSLASYLQFGRPWVAVQCQIHRGYIVAHRQ